MQQPIGKLVGQLSRILVWPLTAAMLLVFTVPSSAYTWQRDIVLLLLVALPAAIVAYLRFNETLKGEWRTACSLFLFLLFVFLLGPYAERGQMQAALTYCTKVQKRLERKLEKKGVYPKRLRHNFCALPRHLRLHPNACRYIRHGRQRYTLSIARTDRPERLYYKSWEGRWYTQTDEVWTLDGSFS